MVILYDPCPKKSLLKAKRAPLNPFSKEKSDPPERMTFYPSALDH